MKLSKVISFKFIYNLSALLLVFELVQGITKYFNPYYFNVYRMGAFAIIVFILGIKVVERKWVVYSLFVLSFLLITLMMWVVWN